MEFKTKGISDIETNHSIVYFKPAYLSTQQHKQLIRYSGHNMELTITVSDKIAISLPKSPFGSLVVEKEVDSSKLAEFLNFIKTDLKKYDVSQLVIHHPSEIYQGFASISHLEKLGCQITYRDINQHIPLVENWKNDLHKMQSRKLQSLHENGFQFRKMNSSELETAHQFISACRQVQGLTINIDWEHLKKLSDETDAYESFGVFRDDKLSAVCITVKVSDEVVYYYLPATSPTFRTESPMVMLIEGMVDYYRSMNYLHFDLGASSILGKPQDSLILFKERMGAIQTEKPTYMLKI
ncbi:MAG: GNAT family N-acetyltransferase [Ekhidna sp.]